MPHPQIENLFAAIRQLVDGTYSDSNQVRDLPSPWITWTLLALIRHRKRQMWVRNIVRNNLHADVERIGTRGWMGHPKDIPNTGLVPRLTDWEYRLHGIGCCLTNRLTGELIDVDFIDGQARFIRLWFFVNFLNSLKEPECCERRLIELHPSIQTVELTVRELVDCRIIRGHQGYQILSLPKFTKEDQRLVDEFCSLWHDPTKRSNLAVGIGDWPAVQDSLPTDATDNNRKSIIDRAGEFISLRIASSRKLFWDSPVSSLALADLADWGDPEVPNNIRLLLDTGSLDQKWTALRVIAKHWETQWTEAAHRLLTTLDPNIERSTYIRAGESFTQEDDVWFEAAELLLSKGYKTEEICTRLLGIKKNKLGQAARLLLENMPSAAAPLMRAALRSGDSSIAAILAVIDEPWCREELLAVLTESSDQWITCAVRAALRASRHPSMHEAVEVWEANHPHHVDTSAGITLRESELLNADEKMEFEMDKFHEVAMRIRSSLAGKAPGEADPD